MTAKKSEIRVLLVDDQTDFEVLVPVLGKLGWIASLARDGVQAIAELERQEYDAVVLDRNMPRKAGDEVLRWIHEEMAHVRPCVIMLTGYPNTDSAVAAVEHGAYHYLVKPVNPAELIRILRSGIALRLCDRMAGKLLTSSNREDLLHEVEAVLKVACQPDRVRVVLVDLSGRVERVYGAGLVEDTVGPLGFVDKALEGRGRRIYLRTRAELEGMDPLLLGAGSLMAVPVPSFDSLYQGVLDMESLNENAFDGHRGDLLGRLADLIGLAEVIRAWSIERGAALLYPEFRHSTATHAQAIGMQAERIRDTELSNIADENVRAQLKTRIDKIIDHADAIDKVVEDLRTATAGLPLVARDADLTTIVENEVEKIRTECETAGDSAIKVTLTIHEKPLPIRGDPSWLGYSLTCMLRNAREAIEAGRRKPATIDVSVGRNGNEAVIAIADNGIGIAPQILEQDLVFQPLFSTKQRSATEPDGPHLSERVSDVATGLTRALFQYPELRNLPQTAEFSFRMLGQGSQTDVLTVREEPSGPARDYSVVRGNFAEKRGIGLYTALRVIRRHGGAISAASPGLNEGATFTVTLPLSKV